MGGLFTVVKVRDDLKSYDEDTGWYRHLPGTVALNDEARSRGTG